MTNRYKEILFIRAEKELAKGNVQVVQDIVLEIFDTEKASGSITARLYDLAKEVA